jgi:predicted N-formylglutamate amidohydrolase
MAQDKKPYITVNKSGSSRCLLICDHARNALPKKYGTLGVSAADRQKHIAWDPGTEDIARRLSDKMDATALISLYSRLLVDLNRHPKEKDFIRTVYDHIEIPGNKNLSAMEKKYREKNFFTPYQDQVGQLLDGKKRDVLLSIHSFTPVMDGFQRPWHIGFLWNREQKSNRALIENLRRKNPGMVIGENEPYSMKGRPLDLDTVGRHALKKGHECFLLEFRQDLINTPAKARKWADIFLDSFLPVLKNIK